MPKRIQRKRTKGWRMPASAIYVGRVAGGAPKGRGKWGNPYKVGMLRGYDHADAVRDYEKWIKGGIEGRVWAGPPPTRKEIREALRGKTLCCWCPTDKPCHADILLKIANG